VPRRKAQFKQNHQTLSQNLAIRQRNQSHQGSRNQDQSSLSNLVTQPLNLKQDPTRRDLRLTNPSNLLKRRLLVANRLTKGRRLEAARSHQLG
jgi:hypothetical protein